MTLTPLITVYITNYNYGKYIRQAVDSILNQTLQDFELIIIDDGSTDNSKTIIEEYSGHPKIKIIYQQNKGLNISNNVALRMTEGKYIMRLDADDYLDENALLVMSSLLEKDDDLGLVFPDYYLIDTEGNILSIEKRNSFKKDVTLLDMPAHGACTMIRKKFLQQLGGYDEQYKCQDGYELWIKFITKYKVTNVNTPLFYYRQHGENLTSNEEKILNTRKKIKENFLQNKKISIPPTIAIIPIRSKKYNKKNIPFLIIKDKYLLFDKIDQALHSKYLNLIVISSPDKEIEKLLHENYPDTKVYFHHRPEELTRMNVSLAETVEHILDDKKIKQINPVYSVILSVEYPFINNTHIDDAIHTIEIFQSNSLISVRPETKTFFQHDGTGMKPILNQSKLTRLEREALYKHVGGITVFRNSYFLKYHKIIGNKTTHIVVDQKAGFQLQSKLDIEIAKFLFSIE